ncbi:hypothetical protein M409DRAFT_37684 [Zasmidium cellare ATCC 36951]|uniref:Amino acid permease/ SLC12A domain-containing protein n=1 Tax=Zasmidium cellare ATCC 36951 TaxID=1080233 RepID=A0A6A6C480_ZASCE|nr:uncharacterized protein M409DRAFT_37684 [Zasmidium cellare ATCC 36951]KAF2160549.1 hypothetical protein M409DRAFT_37684 [Zasmidium cellare ATCC 36951]
MSTKVADEERFEDNTSIQQGDLVKDAPGGSVPKVHFKLWQTLGMNFSITNTPISVGAYLSLIIGLGGFPYYVWCFIFAGFFQLILGLVVAEIASAMPHSSGPAHWIGVLSPPRYAKKMQYLVGWLTIALWWFVSAGNMLYLGQYVAGFAEAMNPGYKADTWQVYLIANAFALLITILNLPGFFKLTPHLMTAAVVVINATWIFVFVAMLVRAEPKATARAVFVDVVNESGWSSDGLVFFLALLPGLLSISGFDSCTHITDEVPSPSKDIPMVIIGSSLLSAFTGFAMIVMFSFCTVSPEGLLDPYGHQPLLNVLKDGLRSDALFCIATTAIILTIFVATLATFTSWNRLYWSFSRTNGLPFSAATSKLVSKDRIPMNALIVKLVLTVALGAIGIGSLTALNAIFGSSAILALLSYLLNLIMAILRGRESLNPNRWLNLGRWGLPLQVVAAVWCVFASVWLCFPLYLPVTPDTMNWTVVIAPGIVILAFGYYAIFRKRMNDPDM